MEGNNSLPVQNDEDKTLQVVESFDQTFENGNLVDTFSQIGEFALDQAIKNDLLRDIPVFGLLISGYKTVVNIKDFGLTKKVFRFLYHLQDTTPKERQKFSKKYCEANQETTSAALLDIIDKLNNGNSVPIVCNLMKAVINEQLSVSQFNRLIVAIQRTAFTDLLQLGKYEKEYDEDGLSDALQAAGLIYQSTYDSGDYDTGENNCKFLLSPNGILLLRYGFNKDLEEKPRFTEVHSGLEWEEIGEAPDVDEEMFRHDFNRGK